MGTNIKVEFGGIRKRKEGKREEANRRGRKNWIERERDKREREIKIGIFLAFRRSNLDGLKVKVDPCIAGYACVPKSLSFVKLREVRNVFYSDYF